MGSCKVVDSVVTGWGGKVMVVDGGGRERELEVGKGSPSDQG